jgi:hypothetical protein
MPTGEQGRYTKQKCQPSEEGFEMRTSSGNNEENRPWATVKKAELSENGAERMAQKEKRRFGYRGL